MAAVFASPIAATLLAVELLLFEWKPRSFIPVSVAAVVAAAARVPLLGAGPVFPVHPHRPLPAVDLAAAAVLGIAAGFGSGLLTVLVYGCEDLFQKLPIHWMWWPAIGGLCVGVGGLIDPRVLGVGYGTIHALLARRRCAEGRGEPRRRESRGLVARARLRHVGRRPRAAAHDGRRARLARVRGAAARGCRSLGDASGWPP